MANESSDKGARTTRVQDAAAKTTVKKSAGAKSASASAPTDGSSTEKAKGAVREQALGLKDKALSSARSAANDGKAKAIEKVGGVSKAIEASAARLDQDVGKTYGDFARSAAKSIDNFAAGIDGKDLDELLDEAKGFIRKSPAIAIGIAAALGFAASRVVKSGFDQEDDI